MGGGVELFRRRFGLQEYRFIVDSAIKGTEIDYRTATVKLGTWVSTGRMIEVFDDIRQHEQPKSIDLPLEPVTIP